MNFIGGNIDEVMGGDLLNAAKNLDDYVEPPINLEEIIAAGVATFDDVLLKKIIYKKSTLYHRIFRGL